MRKRMVHDDMPFRGHSAYQFWLALGMLADDAETSGNLLLTKNVQQAGSDIIMTVRAVVETQDNRLRRQAQ